MTGPAKAPPAAPAQPFLRAMSVAKLSPDSETSFRVTAEAEERERLAPFLGVDAVERLSFAGFIGPQGRGRWRVRGHLVAKIVQTCVVTLEPLRTRIEEDVERVYVPEGQAPRQPEVVLLHDDDDAPDTYSDSIDPAQLAVESLLLLIDPYPRRPGAALDRALAGADSEGEAESETRKPFAGLAALMRGPGAGQA